jgi:glycosyltransferase involved in cell wall biosynthesis
MKPLLSVCILAYNRANLLGLLLDSILTQDYRNFEIVICEDKSAQRAEIARIAADYAARHPGYIRYSENETTLGYDGNLRRVVECAAGEYCMFMGNDDLLCPGALGAVAKAVETHANVGVVLRSYAAFDDDPARIVQEFRYFDRELIFPAGADSIGTVFRRSVVISGMVVNRAAAQAVATDRYDGILLYQLYLVARILVRHDCVYLPQILTLYRNGGVPEFGNAAAERGKFVPREHTPGSSLHFMRGMLEIARDVEQTEGVQIYDRILRDIGNYSYPVLSIQHDKPLAVFWRYYRALGRLGFDRVLPFHLYFFGLVILGPRAIERIVLFVKKRLGYTPAIGDVYKGRPA